jgi:hypothetical protein
MGLQVIRILLLLLLFQSTIELVTAQSRRRNKRTSKREIRKRQEEANKKSMYNRFNELQPMGFKSFQKRIDFIWSYETANTVPERSGDISLFTPSRFSVKQGTEFGLTLGGIPFVPNLFYKKRWNAKNIYVSTFHEMYSYSPLLHFLRSEGYNQIIPQYSVVPLTGVIKNELMFSKAFLKDIKCGIEKQPYIIITAAVGIDYGIPIKKTDITTLESHFVRQRAGVILGGNGFICSRIQGDFYVIEDMFLTVAFRGIFSTPKYGKAFEQNSFLRYRLSPGFTASAGYWLTFGKGDGWPVLPFLDLTYHFGYKEAREKGLFGR